MAFFFSEAKMSRVTTTTAHDDSLVVKQDLSIGKLHRNSSFFHKVHLFEKDLSNTTLLD